MAEQGLARSRTKAARLIAQGLVTVDGIAAMKPSTKVRIGQKIAVATSDHYVSRAAHKLVAALDEFAIDVTGRVALDVGASTGGFTQVLLERDVSRVVALDVGHEQLAPSIRNDDRVTVIEGVNARYLTREELREQVRDLARSKLDALDLVVADLSFISLGMVLPALLETVGPDADFVLLIKPQFEVGRGGIREGLVRDPALREDAVNGVLWAAWDIGLPTAGVIPSPIAGTAGNHEYLAWFCTSVGTNPTEWSEQVSTIARNA